MNSKKAAKREPKTDNSEFQVLLIFFSAKPRVYIYIQPYG